MCWEDKKAPKINKAGRPLKAKEQTISRSVSFDVDVLEALKERKGNGEGSVSSLLMEAARYRFTVGYRGRDTDPQNT